MIKEQTILERLMNTIRRNWVVIAIIGVWLIFSYPYFFKGLVPFPSAYLVDFFPPWSNYYGHPVKNNAMPDVITQIYPWKKLIIESFKMGQVPRWNPYQFAGNPHLANYQSATFSPVNLLFFILPFIDAWSIAILLQPLLAGLFMHLFLRSIKVSNIGSLVGSISFMFCGFIVVWMAYGTLGYAVLYLPLLLYGIECFVQHRIKYSVLVIPVSMVLSFFSGHFQMSVYVVALGFIYGVYRIYLTGKTYRTKMKNVFFMSMLFFAGLVLSLPQIVPTVNFYNQSVRSELFQEGEVIPWSYLISTVAPDFFGNPVTRNDWFGHYAEWASYAGSISLVFALLAIVLALWSVQVRFFALAGLISILLAFDTPLIGWLVTLRFPVLSTSAASRIVVMVSFSVAVLAAIGYDRISLAWKQQYHKKKIFLSTAFFFAAVFTVWILLLKGNLLFLSTMDAEKLSIARRNFVLPSLLVVIALVTIITGFTKNKLLRSICVGYLLFATIVDLLRFAGKWMPFDPRDYVYPEHEGLQYLQKHAGNNRVFGNVYNEALTPFHLSGIEGYDALYIRRYGEFFSSLLDGKIRKPERSVVQFPNDGIYSKRALDLLGVRFLLHAKGDGKNVWAFPYWDYPESFDTPVWSDDQYEIYENKGALPRAFLVYKHEVVVEDQKIIDMLFSDDFDIRSSVVLEKQPVINKEAMQACVTRPPEKVTVDVKTYTPNYLKIFIETPCSGILFLSDNYYPGWSAKLNKSSTEILRADYTFRAIVVPAGQSTVEFYYARWDY